MIKFPDGISKASGHVLGSLKKWINCTNIVAADLGEEVEVVVYPTKRGRGRPRHNEEGKLVIELGSGGGWAPAQVC